MSGYSKRKFWVISGLVLAAAVVAAAVVAAALLLLISDREPEPGETPESAVEAYLTALSEADAEAALEVIDTPPDTAHMTDSVLNYSQRNERIELVEVEELTRMESDSVAEMVNATFTKTRGQDIREISYPFDTQLNEQTGLWEIHDAAISIPRPEVGDLDLTLNAEPFDADETYVFWWPRYELDFDQEYFEFGNPQCRQPGFESNSSGNPLSDMEVTLTDDGEELWRQVLVEAVKECVASTQKHAGCGLDLPDEIDGTEVEEGTVARRMSNDALDRGLRAVVPDIDPQQLPSIYSRGSFPLVDVEYEVTGDGNREESGSHVSRLHRPKVDMETADNPDVEWIEPGHSDLP